MIDDRGTALATAAEARRRNRDLDERLLGLMRRIRDNELAVDPGNGEWTLDRNLGHIAEFPAYFARQLDAWLDGRQVVIGRVAEASPERSDAIVQAPQRSVAEHVANAEAAFAELARVLRRLSNEHLDAPTHNVKYGTEPLRAFLDRYVLSHKAAHAHQLHETLGAVRASERDDPNPPSEHAARHER